MNEGEEVPKKMGAIEEESGNNLGLKTISPILPPPI